MVLIGLLATEDVAQPKSKKAKTPAEPKVPKKTKAADEATKKDDAESIKASAPSKKSNGAEKVKETTADSPAPKAPKEKKAAKSKTTKKSAPEPVEPVEEAEDNDEIMLDGDVDDAEEDDQTAALIQGFESDDDDVEMENDGAFKEGQEIPEIPEEALTMSKKQQKKLQRLKEEGAQEESGVVYIGRIPHGFYENEMKAYFKQFGTIINLRVSRNKKTGASKHYAFVEFESGTVAEIVAKTMDSYLMFGHILKVKLIPAAQVHADLFKGANKRFKKVPWNRMAGRKLNQGMSEEKWDERVDREEQRRVDKADKLKAIGYEFDSPKIKTSKQVVKKEKAALPVAEEVQAIKPEAVEAVPVIEESKPAKKGKKSKAAAAEVKPVVVDEPAKVQEVETAAPAVEASEKPKKGKKAKAVKETVQEVEPETVEAPSVPAVIEVPKGKKGKKAKIVKEVVETVEVVEEVLPAVIEAPAKDSKKRKAETTLAEPVAEVPEKRIKKRTKATLVVESGDAAPEVSIEKVRKIKKSKK